MKPSATRKAGERRGSPTRDPERRAARAAERRAAAERAETRSGKAGRGRGAGRDSAASRGPGSRSRLAAPRRPTRRQALRRRWTVAGGLLAVVAVIAVLLFTPVLGVRSVHVAGVHVLSADQVRTAAGISQGTPLVRVNTTAVRHRVAQLLPVASVRVIRSWPSEVDIEITERTPIAVFKAGDGWHLVDGRGVPYLKVATAPTGLPVMDLPKVSPEDHATRSVTSVLAALPRRLLAKVTKITSSPSGDARFTLAGGKQVKWGTAQDSDRKAAVLKVLLTRPGKVYDVSSPDLPGVS
ncbi:MAG: cell division protein FtsQ/DivIB [Sciscionella sp.]